ncbi:MAG: light-harvesting protein [Hyphomonadaceae bacterium]|jgi:light-harvesting complex 1 alpha chain|nr:light-harvesting protein [Hyphomonadaceae bacterium]
MWKVWLLFDPRRALIGILTFAFFMVMLNHFVQLSTARYGSWLSTSVHAAPAATP